MGCFLYLCFSRAGGLPAKTTNYPSRAAFWFPSTSKQPRVALLIYFVGGECLEIQQPKQAPLVLPSFVGGPLANNCRTKGAGTSFKPTPRTRSLRCLFFRAKPLELLGWACVDMDTRRKPTIFPSGMGAHPFLKTPGCHV